MSNIHYFQRYSQLENVVTNNTLQLLLRLYEFNRIKYEKFMDKLCAISDEDFSLSDSWLRFLQQKWSKSSVVDGFIAQDSIKIAIETKLFDNFDEDQLNRHLSIFGEEQYKLLLLLSPSTESVPTQFVSQVKEHAA